MSLSATTSPPAGAGPVRVTVPVDVEPPATEVGFSVRADRLAEAGAVIVRLAVRVSPLYEPEIVATSVEATAVVETANVAEVEPAGTVTLAGTVAAAELELNATTMPPAGAADVSVAVPVAEFPPTTEVGLTEIEASEAGAGGAIVQLKMEVRQLLVDATVMPIPQKVTSSDGSTSTPK